MTGKKTKKVKIYNKKKSIPPEKLIAELEARYDDIDEAQIRKFTDLPLSTKTLQGLKENNYIEPTDIQKQSIGLALQGNDILGAAKTGSGKTLAFVIPVLEKLYCKRWTRVDGLGALIITPAREVAYQIFETLRKVGIHHDFSVGLIIGGKDLAIEKKRMNQCNIIVCTPGRILQHMEQNAMFDCMNMQILVLDEADRCLDMGFEATMKGIIANLPPERTSLLFSATQTKLVRDLSKLSLKNPIYVSVHEQAEHATPDGLQQSYVICKLEDKMAMLWSFIKNHKQQKIIVFFSTCKQVKFVYDAFCRMRPGITLLALHGKIHQLTRMGTYDTFCKKQSAVLFATDVASRGLDFPSVNWVVQMDCPEDANTYIHRAGRTARFQRGGESLLVLLPSEEKMVEKLRQRKIPISMIKINPSKLTSPQMKLQILLARDESLKESAKRAFSTYAKSILLMKDKEVFDIKQLDKELYARSLGLTEIPRLRFLEKKEKSDGDKRKHVTGFGLHDISDEESDSEIMTTKAKYVPPEGTSTEYELPDAIVMEPKTKKNENPITKAALAKKLLKKKIIVNSKTCFDENGEVVVDPGKPKISTLGEEPGIKSWEMHKQQLREEDFLDNKRYRERARELRREKKRKLKASKKGSDSEQEDNNEDDDEETCGVQLAANDSESESEGEAPDLSWLPDPDKIYGPKKDSSDDERSEEKSEEDEEDSEVDRPRKRKLHTQAESKKSKKKRKLNRSKDNGDLEATEELALQLLRN